MNDIIVLAKQNLSEYILSLCCYIWIRIYCIYQDLLWRPQIFSDWIHTITTFSKPGFCLYYYLVFTPFKFQLGTGCVVDCSCPATFNIRSHRQPTLAALDRWACCCSQSWKKEMCITLAAIHVEAFVAEDTCELYQTVTAIKWALKHTFEEGRLRKAHQQE